MVFTADLETFNHTWQPNDTTPQGDTASLSGTASLEMPGNITAFAKTTVSKNGAAATQVGYDSNDFTVTLGGP
jgi:hypothetical protein